MKVNKNIYLIECPLGDIFTGVYVILDNKITLIDSGMPDSWDKNIKPYLKELGCDQKDISLIIHTHGHGDHIGSDAVIKKQTNARVAIHELDAKDVEDPDYWISNMRKRFDRVLSKEFTQRLSDYRMEPLQVDIHLKEGDMIDTGSMRLKVIHTPGHSKGSICLYDEKDRIIFSGDSIQAKGTTMSDISLVFDSIDDYLSSMKRLNNMKIEMICAAHQFKPLSSPIIDKNDVSEFISMSITNIENMQMRIIKLLRSRKQAPLELMEITKIICKEFGTGYAPPSAIAQAQFTLVAHLENLLAKEKVQRIEKEGKIFWVLAQ